MRRGLFIGAGVMVLLTFIIVFIWAGSRGVTFFVAVASGLSAIGNCAAAVVVAVQTFMTRKAVEAAREATDVSRLMAIEATKTRLDARAPVITIRRVQDILWPPFEPSSFGEAQPLPPGTRYHLPGDGGSLVQVRLHLTVTNHSQRPVRLLLDKVVPAGWDEQATPPTAEQLEAGTSRDFFAIETR